MTAKEIFFKTLQFGWIKLGLGLLNILIAVLLFAILMGISVLFNSDGVVAIMFFIWLGLIGVVNFFLNHYEPALRTDRTRGTHPILQELDNLKDAGTLYGDIIYHKAPIVMRMLEREISERWLQIGLQMVLF